jgi:hypothetical protein
VSKKERKYPDPKTQYVYTPEPGISIGDLAEEWKGVKNCSIHNLRRRRTAEGWVKERERVHEEVREKARELYISETSTRMKDSLVEANERHLKTGQVVESVALKTIQKYHDNLDDMKTDSALRMAVAAAKTGVDIQRKALGMADQVVKYTFAKDMSKEIVEIIAKYVVDPNVLENIMRDFESIVEREKGSLDEAMWTGDKQVSPALKH